MNDNILDVSEGAQAILETQGIVVLVMSFYESGFVGFKIFLGIHVVRVLFHFEGFGFLAEVYTFLEVVFDNVHLGDDSLDADKLVGHFAAQSAGSDEVGSKIAFETDLVVVDFAVELGSLVPVLDPFEIVFGDAVILLGVFDEILGGEGVLVPEGVDIDLDGVGVDELHPRNVVVEEALVVFHLHLAHYQTNIIYEFSIQSLH